MRERYRSWSRSATNCTPRSHPIRISPRKKSRPISARSSSLIYRKDRSSLNGKKQGDLEWLTHERYAHSIPRSDPRTNPRRRIDLIRCFLASGTRVKWIRDFSPVPIPEYFIASPLERSPKFRHVRQFLESLLFFVVFYSLLFLSPCLSLSLFFIVRGIEYRDRINSIFREICFKEKNRCIIRNWENLAVKRCWILFYSGDIRKFKKKTAWALNGSGDKISLLDMKLEYWEF